VSVEDAANAAADEEIPKTKMTDTSPVYEEPHHAATLVVAGRTRHDSIAIHDPRFISAMGFRRQYIHGFSFLSYGPESAAKKPTSG